MQLKYMLRKVLSLLPSSFPGLGGSIKWSKKLIAMFFSLHTAFGAAVQSIPLLGSK